MSKKQLDLDSMLEEIAQKLRPSAQAACGTTQLFNTDPRYNTASKQLCSCYCCSSIVDNGAAK